MRFSRVKLEKWSDVVTWVSELVSYLPRLLKHLLN